MIGLEALYIVAGAFFAAVAVLSARDDSNPKRWKNTAFWGLFAASFLFGSHLNDFANGVLIIFMVCMPPPPSGAVSASFLPLTAFGLGNIRRFCYVSLL